MIFHPIELNGTGFSGTTCETRVNRRRPLIPNHPSMGYTRQSELCGELARWWAIDAHDWTQKRVYCTKHKHATEKPRRPLTPSERLTKTVARYNKQAAASQAAVKEMRGNQALRRILNKDGAE